MIDFRYSRSGFDDLKRIFKFDFLAADETFQIDQLQIETLDLEQAENIELIHVFCLDNEGKDVFVATEFEGNKALFENLSISIEKDRKVEVSVVVYLKKSSHGT